MCQRVEVVSNAFCRQNMDSILHTMSFKQGSCRTKCESNGVFIELCWCFSFCQKLMEQICLFFLFFSFFLLFHGTNLLWQTWAMFDFLRPCACDLLLPCGWIERSASLGFSSSEVFTAAFKVLHEPDLEAFPQAEDLPLTWKLYISVHIYLHWLFKLKHWKWCPHLWTLAVGVEWWNSSGGSKAQEWNWGFCIFTLAIWRWSCSFTWGMCKSLHSGYCGNGNCCIININVIGILRTKLICIYIFFLKLNMDLPKPFVVHSPQSLTSVSRPQAGCMKALLFRYCLQGFNAVTPCWLPVFKGQPLFTGCQQ